jgi:hypothetical protein
VISKSLFFFSLLLFFNLELRVNLEFYKKVKGINVIVSLLMV